MYKIELKNWCNQFFKNSLQKQNLNQNNNDYNFLKAFSFK